MRKIAVLLLVVALAAPAMAQEKKKRGGFGGRGFGFSRPAMLLNNPDVQKDLGLTDAQKETITAFREKQTELFRGFQDMSNEERQEAFKKIQTDSEKLVKDLKPEQQTRLKQLQVQQAGVNLFVNPEAATRMGFSEADANKIKLSDEQKEKIQELGRKMDEEMRELRGGAGFGQRPDEATLKKINALTKEYRDKQLAVLTDDQKKTYKEMTGKPFEGNLGGGFGFGGGFGGKKKRDKRDPN